MTAARSKTITGLEAQILAGSSRQAGLASRTRTVQAKYTAKYIQILEAAAREFSNKGYHVATTKGIAEQSGIQQGSLYYYIKSKEAALEQICLVAIEGYVAFSEEIKRSRRTSAQKVRDLIFNHLLTIEDRPEFFKVFMTQRHDLREPARHEIGKQIRQYERNVESIIRQGVRKGAFRSGINCSHATLALLGMCNYVGAWWGKRSAASIRKIIEEFGDIFVEGLVR